MTLIPTTRVEMLFWCASVSVGSTKVNKDVAVVRIASEAAFGRVKCGEDVFV